MSTLFQAGVFIGLMQGIYRGDMDFKTLASHGDTGLGTINDVDGEMVALDGKFYCIKANGVAEEISGETLTPFSMVAKFSPSITLDVPAGINLEKLNQYIDDNIPSKNIFYMMRIDASLQYLKMRSEKPQTYPAKPLAISLPLLECVYEHHNISGSLIATRCPDYCAPVSIPDFHYHFIDDARKTGGHIYEAIFSSGKIEIMLLRTFTMQLFDDTNFDSKKFTPCQTDITNVTHMHKSEDNS